MEQRREKCQVADVKMTATVQKQPQRWLVFFIFWARLLARCLLLRRIYFCPSASGAHSVNRVFVTALNCAFCICFLMRWIVWTCESKQQGLTTDDILLHACRMFLITFVKIVLESYLE